MNCDQAQKLLPLHVGLDLDEKRAGRIAAHLQSCAACSHVAAEYRESVQLTQQSAAPAFSEAFYVGLRQRVLREIETQPAKVPLSQFVFGTLNLRGRPRMTWAVATVLLIAFTVFGFYLIRKRPSEPQHFAVNPPAVNEDRQSPTSPANPPNAATPQIDRRRSKPAAPRQRNFHNDRSLLAANAPETKLPGLSPSAHDAAASDAKQPLRVEMQTKNPNIRIIWFSHQENKRVSSNSKGI